MSAMAILEMSMFILQHTTFYWEREVKIIILVSIFLNFKMIYTAWKEIHAWFSSMILKRVNEIFFVVIYG